MSTKISESCSVEMASRQVVENKLLTALRDSATVAILASEEDLCILIAALQRDKNSKAQKMAEDFGQLKRCAFPPNAQCGRQPKSL